MRFGTMALQLSSLIPSGMPPDQALAAVMSLNHTDLVRRVAERGFDLLEITTDLVLFLPHLFTPRQIEGLAALKDEMGLSYTVHLPLWSVEPSTPLRHVRTASAQAVIDAVHMMGPLRPEMYVLHATGALASEFSAMKLSDLAKGFILRQFQNGARESLRAILGETHLHPRRLAIETVEFPFDLTLELAEDLDLSICLDTGHVLAGFSGAVDLFDVLERVLPRLGEVHLHDSPRCLPEAPGYGQDHRPLGRGDLDVGRFLDRLAAAGWNGPIILEMPHVKHALDSLAYIRGIRPALLP